MTTRTQTSGQGRTAAATVAAATARARRAQDTAAGKLTAAGWTCFPPEKRQYLEAFLAAHKGDDCAPAPAGVTEG
jgi:hypothetical protein